MMIDYLLVGHITRDVTPQGSTLGGTVTFASCTAQALGHRVAVLTSAAAGFVPAQALPGIAVDVVPAAETTTFENIYRAGGRQQIIHQQAALLRVEQVPQAWQRAAIVHLAPVAQEVEPAMIRLFSNSLVGLTPQGWLRRWDEQGRVTAVDWPLAQEVLPLAAAVIVSEEDLPDEAALAAFRRWSPLLVLTQGAAGCTVFYRDESRQIPAPAVEEKDPTGAGDIFAAAFLSRLCQTDGNPWEAARFANQVAAGTVAVDALVEKMAIIRRQLKHAGPPAQL